MRFHSFKQKQCTWQVCLQDSFCLGKKKKYEVVNKCESFKTCRDATFEVAQRMEGGTLMHAVIYI